MILIHPTDRTGFYCKKKITCRSTATFNLLMRAVSLLFSFVFGLLLHCILQLDPNSIINLRSNNEILREPVPDERERRSKDMKIRLKLLTGVHSLLPRLTHQIFVTSTFVKFLEPPFFSIRNDCQIMLQMLINFCNKCTPRIYP